MKIEKKTITRFTKKGDKGRKTNYYLNEDGVLLIKVPNDIISESYNEQGDIEFIKTSERLYDIGYNEKGNIDYIRMVRRNRKDKIIYDLIYKFLYNNNDKISETIMTLTNYTNNTTTEDIRSFEYIDNSVITREGCIKKKYTDGKIKKLSYSNCNIEFIFNDKKQPISKKIIYNDGSYSKYTYEYSGKICNIKNDKGEVVYIQLLNSNGDVKTCTRPNGKLFYTCEYNYELSDFYNE